MKLGTILRMVEARDRKVDRTTFMIVRSVVWRLGADGEVRKLAEQLGREIVERTGISSVEDVCECLREIGCGDARASVREDEVDGLIMDMGYDNVVVYECISCCGAPKVGETLCALEGGLIQGMIGTIEGQEYYAIEYACWGLGDGRCAFALVPKVEKEGYLRVQKLVRERARA
ncbi:V4R domain-containing protein [Methanopyrus sp.]